MRNKKYLANKKNQGVVPELPVIGQDEYNCPIVDDRVAWIDVPCGDCIECRKEKARNWQVRMCEEIKNDLYKYFITLTFSPEGLKEVYDKLKEKKDNAAAGYALRHALERYRKKYKHSLRHWFVTELGHEGTERIHMHGLLFSAEPLEFEVIERKKEGYMCNWNFWKYGHIFVGNYVSERSVNYLVKYITKQDEDHIDYKSIVLCSPGMGRSFIETRQHLMYKYKKGETPNFYRLQNGCKTSLPTYYRNKFYNENEREQIWRDTMDKDETIIMGNRYHNQFTSNSDLHNVQMKAREINTEFGYGNDRTARNKKDYNITYRQLLSKRKLARLDYLQKKYNIEPGTERYDKMQKIIKKCIENLQESK